MALVNVSQKRNSTVLKKLDVALIGLTTIAATSTAALAHPNLTSSTPADNARVAASPTEIRLKFYENLEPSLSGADVLSKGCARTDRALAARS